MSKRSSRYSNSCPRAEIDEAAWDTHYRTVSRPFPRPAGGKIAVKVINHYGDEMMKIYDVR
jgi:adenine-specific DNA-methyltransferase